MLDKITKVGLGGQQLLGCTWMGKITGVGMGDRKLLVRLKVTSMNL